MTKSIAVLNAGSSSIKFSLYALPGQGFDLIARRPGRGTRYAQRRLRRKDADGNALDAHAWSAAESPDHAGAVRHLIAFLRGMQGERTLAAVGHRVVHGGMAYSRPVRVDATVLKALDAVRAARAAAPAAQPRADSRDRHRGARAAAGWPVSTPHSTARSRRSRRHSRCRRRSPTSACAATASMACPTSTSRARCLPSTPPPRAGA